MCLLLLTRKNRQIHKIMKILCHHTTLPTATLIANELGAELVCPENRDQLQNWLHSLRESENSFAVNWGYRLIREQMHSGFLNSCAALTKPAALLRLREADISVPPFLIGTSLLRPPMTRKGRGIDVHDGIAMELIDKDLEFRVDVFRDSAFRLHVKTGPEDKIAWNREGTDWVSFGYKTMVKGIEERFGAPTGQIREAIELAKRSVKALNYDFGAVDIIRQKGTGKLFVLEVNSAPSLCEVGVRKYCNRIRKSFHESS